MMIFLTMCIAIYSLLSYITAENELSLNKKNRIATVDYYAADAIATKIISELAVDVSEDNTQALENKLGTFEYDKLTGIVSMIIPIDLYRNLDVSLSFADNDGRMTINRYKVVSSIDWAKQIEKKINVIS